MESGVVFHILQSEIISEMGGVEGILMNEFRCTTSVENETRWCIYWIDAEEVFGVTDAKSKVFEKKLDRLERRKFLGNIAESLLEDNWRDAFDDSVFSVKTLGKKTVSVCYVVDKITIESIKDNIPERIAYVFHLAVSTLNGLMQKKSRLPSRPSASTLNKLRPQKAIQKSEHSSVIDPTKRKRNKPTGLQFDD